ncbi:MAG: TMEM165/GDT1 family protein [ANME-2 cluster archaeon]|nr:TMEM165/GDT1 family protein [ANME-2 cluster archaeon]MDF1556572.1 TMEM165/GDT1 family protein [ANME-2 cluster archaeon]
MDLTPALTTFGLIALAEMGDKTQLIAIALSTRYSRIHVFAGLIAAFVVLTALAVGVGEVVFAFIGPHIIGIVAGLLFILFGLITILMDDDDDGDIKNSGGRSAFMTAFSLIALAELGDKTEIAVIALSAQYHAPILVFLGAVLGLGLVSALGVAIGGKLQTIVPMEKLRIGSGILFLVFGVLFLLGV